MTQGMRKIVFAVVLLAMAFVAYKYMIKKANIKLRDQRMRLDVKLVKLEEFEKATAAAQSLNQQLEQLQEAVEFFESKLPPTSEIDKVLKDVTVIVQREGLRSKRVSRLAKKDNSGYIEQPLKMELIGNFNSFYSFLLELEKLPRIMKLRELKLDKQIDQEGKIAASFIVSIFFQNETG